MSKKDYILIADVIGNRFNKVDGWKFSDEKHHTLTEIVTITEDLARLLKQDNPNFDRSKFIEYINKHRINGSRSYARGELVG